MDHQHSQKYTCPMHPQIIRDAPGKCPLCGMTLVPLVKSGGHDMHASHAGGMNDFM
jgi:P-type Cu2+ transporter